MRIALRKPGSPPFCLLSESTKLPILVPVCICAPTRSVKPLHFTPRVWLPCTHISGGNISVWPWHAPTVPTRYFETLMDGNLTCTVSTLRSPTVAFLFVMKQPWLKRCCPLLSKLLQLMPPPKKRACHAKSQKVESSSSFSDIKDSSKDSSDGSDTSTTEDKPPPLTETKPFTSE